MSYVRSALWRQNEHFLNNSQLGIKAIVRKDIKCHIFFQNFFIFLCSFDIYVLHMCVYVCVIYICLCEMIFDDWTGSSISFLAEETYNVRRNIR